MDRGRVDVSYPVQSHRDRLMDDETDASVIRSYRLNATACRQLEHLLGTAWNNEVWTALSACVGSARWRAAIQRAAITPTEMRRASARLKKLRRVVGELREWLVSDESYESSVFTATIIERGHGDDWFGTAAATLAEIEATADAACQQVGVLTIGSEPDGSGGWVTAEPKYVISKTPGRPVEASRDLLIAMAASALTRSGIPISKTRGGKFEKIARVLLKEADLFEPTDLHRTVFRAVDRARWLQQRPARSGR